MAIRITPGHIEADGHVVLTGPIQGTVTTADGETLDVSPVAVEVESPEKAAEVADLIGRRYATEGHPEDVEEVDGHLEQRPFDYQTPDAVAKRAAKSKGN